MPPRKKKKRSVAKKQPRKSCSCGDQCHEEHSHLPGYLLIAFGLLALPVNFGLIPGMDWLKSWPLLLVLFGVTMVAKVAICRSRS